MRSPSVLELVESASGDRRAMIGDVKGVSKSSRDKGLVIGLVTFTFVASEVTAAVVGLIGLMIIELEELSMEAKELLSDLVGLPPTLGFCIGGGLGGGPSGLDGLVVAIEAGLLAPDFLLPDSVLVGLLCFLGVMGGGCLLFFASEVVEAKVILGSASVGVASEDLHTGTKFDSLMLSKLDLCKMGPEMSSLVNRSGLTGGIAAEAVGIAASLLLTDEVGEERPLSN